MPGLSTPLVVGPVGQVGPPFYAPPSAGTPGSAETTYGPGSVTTRTSGGPMGGGGIQDLLAELLRKKIAGMGAPAAAPAPKRILGARSHSTKGTVRQTRGGGGERSSADFEHPWYSLQGAATVPVGLGPAMIPGMGVDPRKLPPSMRPQQANMIPSKSDVPTGSIESPEYEDDSLYGYSRGNPSGGTARSAYDAGRQAALKELMQQQGGGRR